STMARPIRGDRARRVLRVWANRQPAEQKRQAGATAHITGVFEKEQPGGTGDTKNDNRGDTPAAKNSAWPPRPRQDKQRRKDRDEKENMIEIHDRALRFDF